MDINYKDILKPAHTLIMFGTVAVIILAVLFVLGFGVPVTIASLIIFRHMFYGTGALLKFRKDLQERKTQYDYKSDELSGEQLDRENTIVDFGRKNYEFG
jgi:membrane protein implicated in regulation of membrane protease activity